MKRSVSARRDLAIKLLIIIGALFTLGVATYDHVWHDHATHDHP